MARRNQKFKHKPVGPPQPPATPAQIGLRAFHAANYTEAIRVWEALGPESSPSIASGVAEALFRRALGARSASSDPVSDLRRATDLVPGEARYWVHLGLALHRADRLREARDAYARAAELKPTRHSLHFVRGLVELEINRKLDVGGLTWLSPEARLALDPISTLLRNEPQAVSALADDPIGASPDTADPVASLWRGLALIAVGNAPEAYTRLLPTKGRRLPIGAEATRTYYHGLAAVMSGQTEAAIAAWRETAAPPVAPGTVAPTASPHHNISQVYAQGVYALHSAEKWNEAFDQAQNGLALAPGDPWMLRAALVSANRSAEKARADGDWPNAVKYWQAAYNILTGHSGLGSASPVLHNVAIAREALEQWQLAAEAWSLLLNAMPRRSGRTTKKPAPHADAAVQAVQEERRIWLRRRIMDNYTKAGLPEEAITYYKVAIKSAPDDLALRMEYASALLANDQTIAARNEVRRILEKDPRQTDALLLAAEIHQERHDDAAAELSLRRLLEIDPKHDKALHAISRMLLERGVDWFNAGNYRRAREIYLEAIQFAPADPQLLVFLGETEMKLGKIKEATARFDAALATGRPAAYVHVFGYWASNDKEPEARNIIERAKAAGVASDLFYVDLGLQCLLRDAPPLPFGRFGRQKKTNKPTKWEEWGHSLIQQGLDASTDPAAAIVHVITSLGPRHSATAIQYARKLMALQPGNPEHHLNLAVLQGISGDLAGAQATLKAGERFAREQGRADLVESIVDLREEMKSPMFGMLGSLMEFGGPGFLDDL